MKYSCRFIIILDVLESFNSNFISFFGTNLLTECPVLVAVFCLFFTSQEINIKRSPNTTKLFFGFFMDQKETNGPEQHLGGAPRGHNPPGRQAPLVRPGGLWAPRWPPAPPLCTINSQIF